MKLEKIDGIDSTTLESLEGAKIISGVNYDLIGETYDPGCFCDTCDCICNQPCHGEGPCYNL